MLTGALAPVFVSLAAYDTVSDREIEYLQSNANCSLCKMKPKRFAGYLVAAKRKISPCV